MAGETVITLVGNLTADPQITFLSSGAGVANFTVASTPRKFDKDAGEWRDGEALFMRCSLWRQPAENLVDSLVRGARVIVTGRLVQRSFEKDGQKRSVVEMEVDEIGASLKYATVKVNKVGRLGEQSIQSQASDDPWGAAPATAATAGAGAEEPPF